MDPSEIYRAPKADLSADGDGLAAGGGKLFSVRQIAVATFLGTPLAGALLMAENYRALAQPQKRKHALIGGVAAAVGVVVLALILPDRFPNSVLAVAYVLGTRAAADRAQGAEIAAHVAGGGAHQSNWRVVGIGLACLAGFLAVFFVGGIIWGFAESAANDL